MNALNPAYVVPLALMLVVAALFVAGIVVSTMRKRARARQRVVEKPNSHYTSQAVRDTERRHRWEHLPLDRIHEVNRDEVVRLLAKVEALGVDALKPGERTFLDNLAEIARPERSADLRDTGRPISSDLRHRPA